MYSYEWSTANALRDIPLRSEYCTFSFQIIAVHKQLTDTSRHFIRITNPGIIVAAAVVGVVFEPLAVASAIADAAAAAVDEVVGAVERLGCV
jgi:hypothetical protein